EAERQSQTGREEVIWSDVQRRGERDVLEAVLPLGSEPKPDPGDEEGGDRPPAQKPAGPPEGAAARPAHPRPHRPAQPVVGMGPHAPWHATPSRMRRSSRDA